MGRNYSDLASMGGLPGDNARMEVLVSDLPEKLDLVLAREERGGDRMNRRVTPALFVRSKHMSN